MTELILAQEGLKELSKPRHGKNNQNREKTGGGEPQRATHLAVVRQTADPELGTRAGGGVVVVVLLSFMLRAPTSVIIGLVCVSQNVVVVVEV